MYYLQSRYYNPQVCRFINADAFVSTGQGLLGNNMFAYCRNNAVCRIDINGFKDQDAADLNEEVLEDGEIIGLQEGGGDGSQTNGPNQQSSASYNFGGNKGVGYANKRGWSHEMIIEAIGSGQSGVSTNAATGAECCVYGNPSQYVVIESGSRNLVQLTKIGDNGWIPDERINWFNGGVNNDIESIHK